VPGRVIRAVAATVHRGRSTAPVMMDDLDPAAVVIVGVVPGRVVRTLPPPVDLGDLTAPVVVRTVSAATHPRECDAPLQGLQLEATPRALPMRSHENFPVTSGKSVLR
jgi:hypothetical protein